MKFSEKLKKAMQQVGLTQTQIAGLTGKSKGSISMYLSGRTIPPEKVQRDIAVSLGLAPDFFEQEEAQVVVMPKGAVAEGKIKRMLPEEAAVFLGMDTGTVRKGLQQGVFPWGYAIKTSENQWSYFINARRFAEIEGISVWGGVWDERERTCISVKKNLDFEESGETFSVEICLENVSPSMKVDSVRPYLETLFSKASQDLKLNNS